ncbi:TonB-dependent receptor [Steroidobacter sp.]|uniref:TonB-dependent receptor n=1 Tax=Steroidobacter sp. TaxID=1978227 RepID=UPI001A3FAFC0|nr:TonB-dependent receptor [Steroidobacter sp.]MBL8265361.1 TonB-dependent receptor [Steroidobacter sp.]
MSALVLASLLALAAPLPVAAQEVHEFDISTQDSASAIRAFGVQSGLQILASAEDLRGKKLNPVRGQVATETALNDMLAGTGLGHRYVAERTVALVSASEPVTESKSVTPKPAANISTPERSSARQRFRVAQASGQAVTPAAASTPASSGSEDPVAAEEIIVTGSRIARAGYDQPTPVTVIGAEAIERSGFSNVSDILNRTPQVGVGLGSSNSYFNADAGASFINLRGLGTNRTLVLVNGRRRVSGTQLSSAVDLTTIPSNLIGNIEVITGGAAAVYGADAVTGVVNVSLKQDVDGLEFTGRTGLSSRGDADSHSLGITYGQTLDDGRGRFLFGLSHNKEDLLMARERPWGERAVDLFGNPANTGPSDGIFNSVALRDYRYPNTSYGGAFVIGGTRYTYDNAVRPTRNDAAFNASTGIGGDGFNDADFAPLRNESEVLAALTHFDYKLTDAVKVFGEFQYSRTETDSPLQPSFDSAIALTADNPLIPADVLALMSAAGQTTLSVGRTNFDQGQNHRLVDRNTYTLVGGFEGEIGGFQWTAFHQYGRYEADVSRTHERIQSRYLEAVDVIVGPNGTPVCRSTTARAAGCVPLSLFGRNAATPQALAYFDYTQRTNIVNTQTVSGVQLTGGLLDLPAGEVQLATGIEYREETLSVKEDPLAVARLLQRAIGSSLDADFNVKEAFAEVLVPLLVDKPFVRSLSVEGAARFSDYNTVGNTFAWKLGTQWAPIDDVRFRVTNSRSVRAPNLAELSSPGTTSSVFILDPCDSTRLNLTANRSTNCAALQLAPTYSDPFANQAKQVLTSGNSNLKEEESDSWTVGAVFTPGFAPGLSLSIDWFKIEIEDAINVVPLQRLVDSCVDSASIANPFCGLITRRADGAITSVNVTPINVGSLETSGIDFQANYSLPFASDWRVNLSLSGTYLDQNNILVVETDASTLDVNVGEVDNPRWRVNFVPGVAFGALRVDWAMRFIDSSKVDVQQSAEGRDDNNVSSKLYHDLSASYDWNSLRFSAGVNNLFDTAPPFSRETVRGDKRGVLFDNIGRYFFLGLTARL